MIVATLEDFSTTTSIKDGSDLLETLLSLIELKCSHESIDSTQFSSLQ